MSKTSEATDGGIIPLYDFMSPPYPFIPFSSLPLLQTIHPLIGISSQPLYIAHPHSPFSLTFFSSVPCTQSSNPIPPK